MGDFNNKYNEGEILKITVCRKCKFYNDMLPGIGNKKCMRYGLPIRVLLQTNKQDCLEFIKSK